MELKADILADRLTFFGRTFTDKESGTVFFNWSGSGFEMAFCGSRVQIELDGRADCYPTEGTNQPWLAVLADDSSVPTKVFEVAEGVGTYTIFESRNVETHTVRVVKRSENTKGRVGIRRIMLEGELLPAPRRLPHRRLEFIGDSITCGFGNETDGSNLFSTSLEDGLYTYAAIAAKRLDAEYHSLCISGIPLCNSYDESFRIVLPDFPDFQPPRRAMEDYYAYTDRFQQECDGLDSGFEKWDFGRFIPDAVIINLGTNDAFRVKASGNDPTEETHFEQRYIEFLNTLRRLNGNWPAIICTLGPMDYYLYDNILRAVDTFKNETGDRRIFCFKYGGIFQWAEGIGALDHPSAITHERMGRELANMLEKWI
jgi:hypothetical protein